MYLSKRSLELLECSSNAEEAIAINLEDGTCLAVGFNYNEVVCVSIHDWKSRKNSRSSQIIRQVTSFTGLLKLVRLRKYLLSSEYRRIGRDCCQIFLLKLGFNMPASDCRELFKTDMICLIKKIR